MASKRHLESLDPVIFNKLPRLEAEPAVSFPNGLCKSNPLPNPGSENHFNYKGSYFACPLQSPDGPEQPLARWSPAAAYLPYGSGASSQPVPAEGPLLTCLLYHPDSLGAGLQPPGAEKGKDGLMRELLMAREKWGSPPPAPGHPFPVKKPVAVNKVAPLAVPKPVYRAPACFVDPRMALPLGPRAGSLQQRRGDADWALPTASHPLLPGESRGGTGLQRRGPHSDPSLLPLHPSLALPTKEKVGSPVTFSPYYTAFEKYRGSPDTPFLEASCPATHSQGKVPEVPSLSLDPWPKLQPPTASPAPRERPPTCYPHTHYPLPLHKASLLYPPPPHAVEAQPSTLPDAYKAFGSVGSGEPFPGSYLKPQAPRSYFPSPLDTYVPRTAGAVASPPAKSAALPRDAELPRRAGYLPSPGFAFSPSDAAAFGTSFASTEPGCERHRAESPQRQVTVRQNSAFQPVCGSEKVSGGSGGLTETLPKGEGGWMKPSRGEQEPPYLGKRRASPTLQEPPHRGPPAPIIVGKGDADKVKDAAKELVPTAPSTPPPEGLKDPRDSEVPPPSPPMPVINNVFSLAPYRDYLEGTDGSAQVPFSREHLQRDTPPQNMGGSREPAAIGDVSAASSLLPTGTAAGRAMKTGSGVVQSQGESCCGRVPEKSKLVPQDSGSQGGSPGGAGSRDLVPGDIVLDLSLKKRLVRAGETQGPAGQTDREDAEREKEGLGGKVREGEEAKPLAPPLLLELLREWLQRAEPAEELGETPKSPPKPKNGSKVPEAQKRTKGKEIWLAFQDVPALLANLLSQLKTFMFACKCPFPHVVRAGAIFIPIHVVKEKLFPKLPGASVDQVLQEHKVELRPTTLSEERHLRDLELKSCTSRMLKLLALKQLPDIYPDLLNLHWHDSIRQQLGSPASWRGTSDDVVVTRGDLLTQPEVHEDGGMLVGSAGTPGCCLDVADVSSGANAKGQNLGMPAVATARSCSGQKQELPHVLPLQFRLLGVTYTAALSNSSSGRYRQLEEEVRLLLNQVLTSYETFLQANVLEFLNGSVVVRGEALFRGDNPAPTSSHLIRTLVTAVSRGRRPFSWQLEPRSVQSGGFSLENLDPEKLSFSLTALQLGRSRIEALESLTSEVTRCLSAHYPVRNVGITQLRDLHGHLEIDGDIYLDTIVHTDVAEVLQAMTALANCSVDLLSLSVEGTGLHLQVYPFSFLITNRRFSEHLQDPLDPEHQELTRDLGDAVARALRDHRSFLQLLIREFLPGSLICHGDLVFQHPAPTSLEVLEALVLSVGSNKALAGSDLQVDPYSLVVGEDTLEPPPPQPGFPEYGVAIIVVCSLCFITAAIVLLVGTENVQMQSDSA
ncbi:hypothetical protein Q9233_009498 [Columba guinea]|nr:hypothetical protein Q9233_009498 [Columba guinea]